MVPWDSLPRSEAVVAAVSHQAFLDMPSEVLVTKMSPGAAFVDVKSAHSGRDLGSMGYNIWRL